MNEMQEKIVNGLNLLGYNGYLSQKQLLQAAVEEGPKSIEYTKLVNYLTNEIRTLGKLDEQVNPISSPEDAVTFIMEVTSFLRELSCPYRSLTDGLVADRFKTVSDCLLLLDYLTTELMGLRVLQERSPEKKIELKLQESAEAANLKRILMSLMFSKPPANVSLSTLFAKISTTIDIIRKKCGAQDLVGQAFFAGVLSDKQWETLKTVQTDLHHDYKIRREMLLTRLDVTVQSFQWSDSTKGKDQMVEKIYSEKRKLLKAEPDVSIGDMLAARTDLAIIEKTSNSSIRKNTQTSLNKVIIGEVPDRGGRTSEQAPPPPEMPSWQQRTGPPANSGNPRGGGGFKRGGGQRGDHNASYHRGGGGGGGNYSRNNYNNYAEGASSQTCYDSAGSYSMNNQYSNYEEQNQGNYSNAQSYSGRGDQRWNSSSYEQTNKRPRTYESFQQPNKMTYTDQYVEESNQNQQYHSYDGNQRRGGRGGRSNYRGRGRNY